MSDKDTPRRILKELLLECTPAQQLLFKRAYCAQHLEYNLDEALRQMNAESIDMAINQCHRTVKLNKTKKV